MMASWRDELCDSAITLIEQAIARCRIERTYEQESPTIKKTLATLAAIEEHATKLFMAVDELSKVGRAAIFERSLVGRRLQADLIDEKLIPSALQRVEIGEREFAALLPILNLLAPSAGLAKIFLDSLYSPAPEPGQGSGSSAGRDSDLKAVRLDFDVEPTGLRVRNAKDKFAVRVLLALFEHKHFTPSQHGNGPALTHFLASVWCEVDTAPASFANVIRQRKLVRSWAVRREEAAARWAESARVFAECQETSP